MAFEIVSSFIQTPILDQSPASPTFTGPFATGQAVAVILKQIGKLICLEVAALAAAPAVAAAATASGVIPAALRPLAQVFCPIIVISNVAILAAPGRASVNTSGDIIINADLLGTLNWLAVGNNGWNRFSLSWTIA